MDNMRAFLILIIVFITVGCKKTEPDFYYCANKAGLFSRDNAYAINLDEISNFKDIKDLVNEISDTLLEPKACGLIYNYADSIFAPHIDSKYNLTIESFILYPKGSHGDLAGPWMEIFISHDSVEIFNEMNGGHIKLHKSDVKIRKLINDYYYGAYCIVKDGWTIKYIHIIIPDDLNFNDYLLPCFRMLLNSYKASIEKYTAKNETCICDSSIFKPHNIESTNFLRFGILIDDYDREKKKTK
jgi:hypothetical protein